MLLLIFITSLVFTSFSEDYKHNKICGYGMCQETPTKLNKNTKLDSVSKTQSQKEMVRSFNTFIV